MVLNLIINGIPSIPGLSSILSIDIASVLNLIINGIPSILKSIGVVGGIAQVLNLIINGIPSIQKVDGAIEDISNEF